MAIRTGLGIQCSQVRILPPRPISTSTRGLIGKGSGPRNRIWEFESLRVYHLDLGNRISDYEFLPIQNPQSKIQNRKAGIAKRPRRRSAKPQNHRFKSDLPAPTYSVYRPVSREGAMPSAFPRAENSYVGLSLTSAKHRTVNADDAGSNPAVPPNPWDRGRKAYALRCLRRR